MCLTLLVPDLADARRKKKKKDPKPPPVSGPAFVPCDDLEGDATTEYNRLVDSSTELYGAEDFVGAIDAMVQLKRICNEDPRLDFNLARAYQRAGNCNMARFWFEELLARGADQAVLLAEDRPKLAQEAIDNLSQECTESARITMNVVDPDVVIELTGEEDEPSIFVYPFEGRVDAGNYLLTASREGFESVAQRVKIVANQDHFIDVPPLVPESLRGTLRVSCPSGVNGVALKSLHTEGDTRKLSCGEEVALTSGSWAVDFEVAGHPFRETVEIGLNRQVDLHLTRPLEPDTSLKMKDWGWITIATGSTLALTGVGLFIAGEAMKVNVLEPASNDPQTGEITDLKSSRKDVEGRGQLMQIAGLSAGGVGVALVITGIVLVSLPEGEEDETEDSIGFAPLDGGMMMRFERRF